MRPLVAPFLLLITFLTLPVSIYAQETIHHKLKISLLPEKHLIEVEDTITLPETIQIEDNKKINFILHKGMHLRSTTSGVKVRKVKGNSMLHLQTMNAEKYVANLPKGIRSFTVKYKGEILNPLQVQKEERDRNFQETSGIISSDGVYLASSSAWYPLFGNHMLTFSMDVTLPDGWMAVTQGGRTVNRHKNKQVQVSWEEQKPQDDIYLIAGKFTEYAKETGPVKILVFLRRPDEKLANKYLDTGAQYLAMYSKLLGPYPYSKFALIENFWETGYGMPSFTLLGPQIIRFPFILHSSYPHEILHNWWGNGVFIDFETGNWSEGLTAYLSDYLIKEQRGQGKEYRLIRLQKYLDYVAESKDFPLTEFRSRHSSATEAVGYGKTTMFFHMLRLQLGDQVFTRGLQKFYREYEFKKATFEDLRNTFLKVSGKDLLTEFNQWVNRTGAPSLRISDAKTNPEGDGYRLSARLEQTQKGPAYKLRVPVAVYLKDHNKAYQTTVLMEDKSLDLSLQVPSLPLRLDVDPEFDLFRRLDRNEIPPALSQAFGSEKALIILPTKASKELKEGYQELAKSWQQAPSRKIDIIYDNELDKIPDDRTVWIFGNKNRFISTIMESMTDYEVTFHNSGVTIKGKETSLKNHSLVLSAKHPLNSDFALVWLSADNLDAIAGLGRKLPHYGKYSYLAFEGSEPSNVLKGRWSTVNSPMSIPVRSPEGTVEKTPIKGTLEPRKALAQIEQVFSGERMMDMIGFLASNNMKGRGFGTDELDKASDFIAAAFRDAGLKPGGDRDDGYFQAYKASYGEPAKEATLRNVIGIIPGSKPELDGQSVIIGAHYDHLGLGWPDVRGSNRGKIHPGADDNASGIAILMELAKLLGKNWKPDRTVVFAAFSGEEAGLLGSQHYVKNEKHFPVEKAIAMLNMDTVGRLGSKKLQVLGTGSAREWIHIFMGISYVTGVQIASISNDFGSSDQKSFHDTGVPAVQFFTGPHLDYHSPADTVDKVNKEGLIKVASVVKEALEYLATRPEPLNSTLNIQREDQFVSSRPTESGRKVSLGIMPNFAYDKKGVKIEGIVPDSPAEKAGLKKGDIIRLINDTTIEDLEALAKLLKKMKPGDTVSISFLREGNQKKAITKLEPRAKKIKN